MPPILSGRLLLENSPNSGAWNMALDEALLSSAIEDGFCSIRFYRWSEATISLGYFQKFSPEKYAEEFGTLAVVRRLSGGGAILHHRELTYSLALPASHPVVKTPADLYLLAHHAILDVLAEHGVTARLRESSLNRPDEPFLCFGRGDPRDIVLEGQKIVGSAQRRRKGAVLQHGSILWERSPHAPQFPGLADLCPQLRDVDPLQLAAPIAKRMTQGLGLPPLETCRLSDPLRERAALWAATRYARPESLRSPRILASGVRNLEGDPDTDEDDHEADA